ncbi:hypothetical protein EON66_01090 [archaeon]|nr:MAG: hypothetical protein EON66_01090 [archaeon]
METAEKLLAAYHADNTRLAAATRKLGGAAPSLATTHVSEGVGAQPLVPGTHADASVDTARPPLVRRSRDAAELRSELERDAALVHAREQLEEVRLSARQREAELLMQLSALRKEKREVECKLGGVDLHAIQAQSAQESELITSLKVSIAEQRSAYEKELAALRGKVEWYRENQHILDADAATIAAQSTAIRELQSRLLAVQIGGRLDGVVGPADVDASSSSSAAAASERRLQARIQALEAQLAAAHETIRKRNPDSLSNLIHEAKGASGAVGEPAHLVASLQELRARSEAREEAHERSLRSLRQEYERMKAEAVSAERRAGAVIKKLVLRLSSHGEAVTIEGDAVQFSGVSSSASTAARAGALGSKASSAPTRMAAQMRAAGTLAASAKSAPELAAVQQLAKTQALRVADLEAELQRVRAAHARELAAVREAHSRVAPTTNALPSVVISQAATTVEKVARPRAAVAGAGRRSLRSVATAVTGQRTAAARVSGVRSEHEHTSSVSGVNNAVLVHKDALHDDGEGVATHNTCLVSHSTSPCESAIADRAVSTPHTERATAVEVQEAVLCNPVVQQMQQTIQDLQRRVTELVSAAAYASSTGSGSQQQLADEAAAPRTRTTAAGTSNADVDRLLAAVHALEERLGAREQELLRAEHVLAEAVNCSELALKAHYERLMDVKNEALLKAHAEISSLAALVHQLRAS